MKNIPYEGYKGIRMPKEIQKQRVQRVIMEELTPIQREVMTAFYFEHKSMAQISRERGVHRSTICRTLQRGERRCRRCLKY